jgi:hypothetical protein
MMMVAAVQTMVPLHCWPFLASSSNYVDDSTVDDSGQQQWPQSARWCLAGIVGHPLPAGATATMGAAWTNGGGAEDCEALKRDK